jgi:FG-GAP-like repeat
MKYYFFYLLFFSCYIWSCVSNNSKDATAPPKPTNLSGKELATLHCGSCHLMPTPDLLDKTTWNKGIFPEMSYYMGIKPASDKFFTMTPDDIMAQVKAGIYPSNPLLAQEDWQKIVDYYTAEAPEKLPQQKPKETVKIGLPFFEVKMLNNTEGALPFVSMIKIDTTNHAFYLAHRNKSFIETYNSAFKKIDSIRVESPVSDIVFKNKEKYLLQMGIMDPNEAQKGKLSKTTTNQTSLTTLVDSLQRPVNLAIFDINQDGTDDYLICNYGNLTGKLAWYDGKTHQETVLKPFPGARNVVVKDMNNDGFLDIVVLMCQAREGVSIFYNKGTSIFEEDIVLQFPPVYGSSYMDLADMNGDGKPDIVYTNGDNADYSMVLKPYHGVRIFINEGSSKESPNTFKEQFFYPVYGAGKVITADFDKDGDLDMATIAFFPDEKQTPHEGFLFFENKGHNTFKVSTFTNSNNGKWLVMDVGDLDGDGKTDILLGSYVKGKFSPTSKSIPTIVWLKNTAK